MHKVLRNIVSYVFLTHSYSTISSFPQPAEFPIKGILYEEYGFSEELLYFFVLGFAINENEKCSEYKELITGITS